MKSKGAGAGSTRWLYSMPGLGSRAIALRNSVARNGYSNRAYSQPMLQTLGTSIVPQSDVSDHLNMLYFLACMVQPKLIVECGVREGHSTRALLAAAREHNAVLISVDLDDCSQLSMPEVYRRAWHFVQADDVSFLRSEMSDFCRVRGLEPQADLIFFDTSHVYRHTKEEIEASELMLRPGGLLLFHDTNLREQYLHLDNSVARGWNNDRGVIRAIEERMGRAYDENAVFSDNASGWLVFHVPFCSGLTVLRKPSASNSLSNYTR